MKAVEIVAAITTKVKLDLQNHADDLNQPLGRDWGGMQEHCEVSYVSQWHTRYFSQYL